MTSAITSATASHGHASLTHCPRLSLVTPLTASKATSEIRGSRPGRRTEAGPEGSLARFFLWGVMIAIRVGRPSKTLQCGPVSFGGDIRHEGEGRGKAGSHAGIVRDLRRHVQRFLNGRLDKMASDANLALRDCSRTMAYPQSS